MNSTIYEVSHCGALSTPHSHPNNINNNDDDDDDDDYYYYFEEYGGETI